MPHHPGSTSRLGDDDHVGALGATPSAHRAEGPERETGEQPVAPATIGEVGGYRLLERLGAGGMGTVYSALDADGHRVALKRIHPHIAEEPSARERLQREVALLHRVRDAGVARVLDAEVDAAEAFLVTELIDGPTLEEDVRAHGPFAADELSGLAHGLARALRAIHATGIVHRDLKPSNVMLSGDGPVLIDFGIAQVIDDARLTQTGMVTGTPGYVDPELIGGAEPGPEHDWWAWAAILLFAASGRPPFGTGPMAAVLARVSTGAVDTEGAPELVGEALAAALDPDPARRLDAADVLRVVDGHWGASELAGATSRLRTSGPGRYVTPDPADGRLDAVDSASGGDPATVRAPAAHMPPSFPPAGPRTAVTSGEPARTGEPAREQAWAGEGRGSRVHDEPRRRPLPYGTGPGWGRHEVGAGGPTPAAAGSHPVPSSGRAPAPWQPGATPGAGRAGSSPTPWPYGDTPAPRQDGGAPGAYRPVPARYREPRRRPLTVALVALGLSPIAAVRPGYAILGVLLAFVVLGTVGAHGRARRRRWRTHGERPGDTMRDLVRVPWDLVVSVLLGLLGVLLGALAGALMFYVGEGLFAATRHPPEWTAWVTVAAGTLVAWVTPTSRVQRLGARALLAGGGRGEDAGEPRGTGAAGVGRAVLVALALGTGAAVLLGVVQGAVITDWVPWTAPPPLDQLLLGP